MFHLTYEELVGGDLRRMFEFIGEDQDEAAVRKILAIKHSF